MSPWYGLTHRPYGGDCGAGEGGRMPFAEWWLKKWSPAGNDPNFVKVQIDPAEVWGCRGAFGPMLVLPYKLPKGEGPSASMELLSLEGWIGLGNVTESDARLAIPLQIVWPAPQQ